ncbi:MAG: ABC transporter permease [Candidatus Bathyarchaeia archaeon]
MAVDVILEGIIKAVELIVTGDQEVLQITLRSLFVSSVAIALSALWGIPIGTVLALKRCFGVKIAKGIFNGLLGLPTVTLGLLLYLLFSHSGPLGIFDLLYTLMGIAIGQAILITPVVVSFTASAVEAVDPEFKELARTLGASRFHETLVILNEAKNGIILSIIAAFNRGIGELGVALMIGGNIRGFTRVLTTAIALETARGNLPIAIALAIILLVIVVSLSVAINVVRTTVK